MQVVGFGLVPETLANDHHQQDDGDQEDDDYYEPNGGGGDVGGGGFDLLPVVMLIRLKLMIY